MNNQTQNISKWWGQFEIPVDSGAEWQIESLRLAIHHLDKEWQISYQRENNDDSLLNVLKYSRGVFDSNDYSATTRHIFRKSTTKLELKPQLADRTVVTRPATPISLAPGEEVTLYISSPLWLQLEIVGKGDNVLEDISIHRPSDTWFGPSSRVGELCYASKTSGRINLENLPARPTRAITPLAVINRASDKLLIDKIALPVPLLSLFATEEGLLWTQPATLIRDDDGDMAELKLGKDAPKEAKGAERINKPRKQPEKGMLVRAFSSIFEKGI